jgi:hypothetical protein
MRTLPFACAALSSPFKTALLQIGRCLLSDINPDTAAVGFRL